MTKWIEKVHRQREHTSAFMLHFGLALKTIAQAAYIPAA